MAVGDSLKAETLTEATQARVAGLRGIAEARGQSLAQYALAWALRDPRMTSLVIGASSVAQLDENLDALSNLEITDAELAATDEYATESGINLWARATEVA
jgi:L-glyceraldehyde 3-phosphate reductase